MTTPTTIYLLTCANLEQDGSQSFYVREAYVAREEARAEAGRLTARYKARVERMNAQQRHRHAMETWSVDEAALIHPEVLP